jgi:hypothetical protein
MLLSDDAKTATKPVPVYIQMMRSEVKTLEELVHEVRMERERAKIETRAPLRVTLIQRASVPEGKD